MSKLGDHTYPDLSLSDAIAVAELVIRQYKGTISTSGLAAALEMSEKGGGFLNKMAALRDYGLLEGRGTLSVTSVGEQIILPNSPAEGARAAVNAYLRVPLFEQLDMRLGEEVPDLERFGIILGEITRDRIQARRKARRLLRIHSDYANHLREANRLDALEESIPNKPPIRQEQLPKGHHPQGDTIELRAGQMHLTLPRATASIQIIASALEVLKKEIEKEDRQDAGPVIPEHLVGPVT